MNAATIISDNQRGGPIAIGDGGGDWGHESIAAAGDRLDKDGILGGVAQGVSEPLDGGVEAVVEVDEGVGLPEAGTQVVAGDDFSGSFEEKGQDPEGLLLEFDAARRSSSKTQKRRVLAFASDPFVFSTPEFSIRAALLPMSSIPVTI